MSARGVGCGGLTEVAVRGLVQDNSERILVYILVALHIPCHIYLTQCPPRGTVHGPEEVVKSTYFVYNPRIYDQEQSHTIASQPIA